VEPLKVIIPQLPAEVPLVGVNVMGFDEVPTECNTPLTINEQPLAKRRVAPADIVSVTPDATVMFSEIRLVPDKVIFCETVYPMGQRFTAGSPYRLYWRLNSDEDNNSLDSITASPII
jgi:hypothetical protein